jgi:hypothetical protein
MSIRCPSALALVLLALGAVPALNAAPAADASVIRYSPGMNAEQFRALPDSARLVLPDGRQLRVGDLRKLTALGKQMRATTRKQLPPALVQRSAPRGTRVASADDLRAALSRPDTDTIELPSGKRMTVGQLRFVMPQVERGLGRPLGAGGAAAARVIHVNARSDWKGILKMPDATLLETSNGTRVTVGDIKRRLREESTPRIGMSR